MLLAAGLCLLAAPTQAQDPALAPAKSLTVPLPSAEIQAGIDSPLPEAPPRPAARPTLRLSQTPREAKATPAAAPDVVTDPRYGIFPLTTHLEPGRAAHFMVALPAKSADWDSWQVLFDTRGFSNDQLWIDGGALKDKPTVEGQIVKMPLTGTFLPVLILSGPKGKMIVGKSPEIQIERSFWGDYFNHSSGVLSNPIWAVALIAGAAGLLGAVAALSASLITANVNEAQRRRYEREREKHRLEDAHKRQQQCVRLHLQKLILRLKEDIDTGSPEGVSITEWAAEADDPSWAFLLQERPASDIIRRATEAYRFWQQHKETTDDLSNLRQDVLTRLDDEFQNIIDIP